MFQRYAFFRYFIFSLLTLGLLSGCAAPRPNITIPAVQPAPLVLSKPPRVALVLGGGGARGFAHIGVLRVLQQENIPVDLIIGTSAGSIVGAVYADNASALHTQQILLATSRSSILDFSAAHALQGPVTGNGLQNFILNHLRARTFAQLKIPFIAMATDLTTGQAVELDSGPIAPAVNASSALAPFFRPVHLYGKILVDGGSTDPVAVDVAKQYGSKIIIAVSIAPDLPSQMPDNAMGVYGRTYIITDLRFNRYSTQGADVVLHPNVGQVGVFDDSHRRSLILAGENAARKALPQICELLIQNKIKSNCS